MKCLRVVLFLLCAFFGSLIGTRAIELPWPVAGFGLAYVDNSGTNVAVLTDGVGGVVGVYGGGTVGWHLVPVGAHSFGESGVSSVAFSVSSGDTLYLVTSAGMALSLWL